LQRALRRSKAQSFIALREPEFSSRSRQTST
jgi:hypothetical protein